MNWIKSKTIWGAIKRAVRDIEDENKIKFGNSAWQRMKELEEELIALEDAAVNDALELHGMLQDPERVDQYLRDNGCDPDRVVERLQAVIRRASAKSPLGKGDDDEPAA